MAYATSNTDFLKRAGNYNIGKQLLDEEITLSQFMDTSVDNLASGSYYKIFAVPANFALLDAFVICHTAEGATGTVDIVDDDSATTTFVNDANVNSAGAVGATAARKLYTSAGFIVILPNNALDTAKFEVVIRGKLIKTTD